MKRIIIAALIAVAPALASAAPAHGASHHGFAHRPALLAPLYAGSTLPVEFAAMPYVEAPPYPSPPPAPIYVLECERRIEVVTVPAADGSGDRAVRITRC